MRDIDNIKQLLELAPDFMGLIFYPPSKRYVGEKLTGKKHLFSSKKTQRVGVFVNASVAEMLLKVEEFQLNALQLHGTEPAQVLRELNEALPDCSLFKAFGVGQQFDFRQLDEYEPYTSYFLFDTKTDGYGGSGRSFDWSLLESYQHQVPYFLSGGLGYEQLLTLKTFLPKLPGLFGIDLNSQVEREPGLKSIESIRKILKEFF